MGLDGYGDLEPGELGCVHRHAIHIQKLLGDEQLERLALQPVSRPAGVSGSLEGHRCIGADLLLTLLPP
jgi:hypothetical protein